MRNVSRVLPVMAALMVGPALAETVGGEVIAQLQEQGYQVTEVRTTWLGRVRITAELDGLLREIVLNPNTGELLRDWQGVSPQLAARDGGAGGRDRPGGDGQAHDTVADTGGLYGGHDSDHEDRSGLYGGSDHGVADTGIIDRSGGGFRSETSVSASE